MYNLNDDIKRQQKEKGVGGGIFKFEEGSNKIRIISRPIIHVGQYKGDQTVKYVAYVLDYKDGQVKPAFLPKKIINDIGNYQINTDYAFDDFPMPYDITVMATGAGTKEVKYSVLPAKHETQLSEEALEQLKKKKPIEEFVSGLDSQVVPQAQFDGPLEEDVDEVNKEIQ
jgi:hypothetical protein